MIHLQYDLSRSMDHSGLVIMVIAIICSWKALRDHSVMHCNGLICCPSKCQLKKIHHFMDMEFVDLLSWSFQLSYISSIWLRIVNFLLSKSWMSNNTRGFSTGWSDIWCWGWCITNLKACLKICTLQGGTCSIWLPTVGRQKPIIAKLT
jgi:hypothetical protein